MRKQLCNIPIFYRAKALPSNIIDDSGNRRLKHLQQTQEGSLRNEMTNTGHQRMWGETVQLELQRRKVIVEYHIFISSTNSISPPLDRYSRSVRCLSADEKRIHSMFMLKMTLRMP